MIDAGASGICILANYSEQFLLSDDEREVLTEAVPEHVAGRVPVIVTTQPFQHAHRGRAQPPGAGRRRRDGHDDAALSRRDAAGRRRRGSSSILPRVADAVAIPIMVQDAPVSGVALSVPFLARLAREVPHVAYFKIEVPGAAAKLRELIAAGGDADRGAVRRRGVDHADGRPRRRRDRHDAERLLPDLIEPSSRRHAAGRREEAAATLRAHPAADQLREPAVRAARRQDGDEGGRRDRQRHVRHPLAPLHPATRAGLLELARAARPAGAALGRLSGDRLTRTADRAPDRGGKPGAAP